ncbi:MAG: DUF3572 domain-containing protein [Rhizobiaceae bacterium]|nr:DUF3572 domain-containing protein [Rhizobiaceae bacterium]
MTPETATGIAIEGLEYLAGDTEQLSRFVALTGMSPTDMRNAAASPEFLAAILDFFLGDEPTLLAFAATRNTQPEDIQKARFVLDPPSEAEAW